VSVPQELVESSGEATPPTSSSGVTTVVTEKERQMILDGVSPDQFGLELSKYEEIGRAAAEAELLDLKPGAKVQYYSVTSAADGLPWVYASVKKVHTTEGDKGPQFVSVELVKPNTDFINTLSRFHNQEKNPYGSLDQWKEIYAVDANKVRKWNRDL